MAARNARYRTQVVKTLLDTGMFRPSRPDRSLRSISALRRWGPTPAAAYTGAAARFPERIAIIDERGTVTFGEEQRRTNALAHELRRAGIREGDGVAIMCRNHRGFIDATVACSKLGASVLYLNTMFAGPQIADVLEREGPTAVIYDEEFAGLIGDAGAKRKRFIAWREPNGASSNGSLTDPTVPLLEDLIAAGSDRD